MYTTWLSLSNTTTHEDDGGMFKGFLFSVYVWKASLWISCLCLVAIQEPLLHASLAKNIFYVHQTSSKIFRLIKVSFSVFFFFLPPPQKCMEYVSAHHAVKKIHLILFVNIFYFNFK